MISRDSLARCGVLLGLFLLPNQSLASSETCQLIGNLAEKAMTMRQDGRPLSSAMSELVRPTDDATASKILREVTMAAYEKPLRRTPEDKAIAIVEFRNAWEMECFKVISG